MSIAKTAILIMCIALLVFVQTSSALCKDYSSGQLRTMSFTEEPIRVILGMEMTIISFSDFSAEAGSGMPADTPEKGRGIAYLHPALGDNGAGNLVRLYEYYDGVSPLSYIFINGSDDDGQNWQGCCWIDLYGGTYPSVDFWGWSTHYCGTFVPPGSFQNGAAFMLIYIPDSMDSSTWIVNYSSMAAMGWHDMKMVAIACDDGQQSWNWGFQSAVISKAYGPPLIDVPFVFGQHNMQPFGSYYETLEYCQTTAADIDPLTARTFAVYDRHDPVTSQYRLLIRQDFYNDWYAGTDLSARCFVDTNLHIRYPVVAAYDNQIVVVAAAYHDSAATDFDIICWSTTDGDVDSLNDLNVVAATAAPENFPELSHVSGSVFVCTFVNNRALYASWTADGGLTWSAPQQVSDSGQLV
ncbi:MAG: hypothetical protein KAT58_09105, partial [candidate division Zixibacteria bacterium]|nr:hypothetical protein [candidate division Zixibacteria bacterium]